MFSDIDFSDIDEFPATGPPDDLNAVMPDWAEPLLDEPTGLLSVLNVGAGDLEFRFSRHSTVDVAKAKQVIADMLKRGYSIFVEVEGGLRRVDRFDAKHEVYIVKELPGDVVGAGDASGAGVVGSGAVLGEAHSSGRPGEGAGGTGDAPPPGKGKRGRKRGVPMRTSKATAIAPTVGG